MLSEISQTFKTNFGCLPSYVKVSKSQSECRGKRGKRLKGGWITHAKSQLGRRNKLLLLQRILR